VVKADGGGGGVRACGWGAHPCQFWICQCFLHWQITRCSRSRVLVLMWFHEQLALGDLPWFSPSSEVIALCPAE
jgi:hypothetical protein